MAQSSTRKVIGIVLVACMVLLAGCSGSGLLGGNDAPSDDEEDDEEDEEDEETTANGTETMTEAQTTEQAELPESPETPTTPASPGTSSVGNLEAPSYTFTEGESYTYNASFVGAQSTNTWDVTSVQNGRVTVDVTQETTRGTQSTTIEGNQSSIFQAAGQDQAAQLFAIARTGMLFQGVGTQASAGSTFTVEQSDFPTQNQVTWSQAELTVGSERTVAGAQCTQYTLTVESQNTQTEFCINEDYPFPLSLTSSQQGRTAISMEMASATRP